MSVTYKWVLELYSGDFETKRNEFTFPQADLWLAYGLLRDATRMGLVFNLYAERVSREGAEPSRAYVEENRIDQYMRDNRRVIILETPGHIMREFEVFRARMGGVLLTGRRKAENPITL